MAIQLTDLMSEILNRSCSNPYYPEDFDYLAAEREMRAWNKARPAAVPNKNYPDPPGGWHKYEIEVHCWTFTVIAKKVMGVWIIQSYSSSQS